MQYFVATDEAGIIYINLPYSRANILHYIAQEWI